MFRSGEQFELRAGNQTLVATSIGATLRTYTVRGRPVIDGFAADEICPSGRGQVLMPWPNRIADGHYRLGDKDHQLPIDEIGLGHAIHGLVRWSEWELAHRARDGVRFRHRLVPRSGYPFFLELSVEYRLASDGLTVAFGAKNLGAEPCPFGAGSHPYFTLGGLVDHVELRVVAMSHVQVDARSIPLGRAPVEGSPVDFLRGRRIGPSKLDDAFTELDRDPDGIARVFLWQGDAQLTVWMERAFPFVQVFTGDTLPDEARRRMGVAVEPMTCAPNAFNSGEGLLMLAPGESWHGRWGVTASF